MINPLYLLIAAQTYFVLLGKTRLEFNIGWLDILVALVTAIAAELLFSYIERRYKGQGWKFFFPWSAVAAALGLAIFFRATNPVYFALAAVLAIGSKYLIRVDGKHIFNPSNFAVVVSIFLLPWAATVELTQWGSDLTTYLLIAAICLYVAWAAGVWLTTLSFLLSYTALLFISIPYHLDILAVHHYGLLGPSLIIFASFMITDPRTAPAGTAARILHGLAVAAGFFLFELLGVKYSLFAASFLTALLGVGSAFGMRMLAQKTGAALPKNLLTCAVILACMGVLYARTITKDGVLSDAKNVSAQFLLMGVESPSIRQCAAEPLFVRDPGLTSPPGMTTGAAWGDFDRDGREDLFISNLDIPSRLYRNTPEGFVDATPEAGLPEMNSQSAFFADYDNDGERDLFVVYGMREYLAVSDGSPAVEKEPVTVVRAFRNTGGRFTDVTALLGLEKFKLPPGGGTMSFGDYNNDGYLDFVYAERSTYREITSFGNRALLKSLFEPYLNGAQTLVCEPGGVRDILERYATHVIPALSDRNAFAEQNCLIIVSTIPLSEEAEARTSYDPANLSVVALYRPGSAHLFKNVGGSTFAEHAPFADMTQKIFERSSEQYFADNRYPYDDISATFYQPLSFDYDADGRLDIFLNLDWGSNLLMRNRGGLSFEDVTARAGLNRSGNGMGGDIGDYDGDGLFDIVSSNVRRLAVFKNNGDGTFSSEHERLGLNRLGVAWGISFLDYDLDGREDLFVGNGGVEVISNVPSLDLSRALFRSDKLYRNTGGDFADATAEGFCPAESELTRPVAVADYDHDGDPDILSGYFSVGVARTPPTLYQNGASGNYISVELEGTVSNRDAVGAVVSVTSDGRTQKKVLLSGSSFYAQNSHTLLFGLGQNDRPVTVEVLWPSGKRTTLRNTEINRLVTVVEPVR